MKRKPPDIKEEEIMEMINDICKYLIKTVDWETN